MKKMKFETAGGGISDYARLREPGFGTEFYNVMPGTYSGGETPTWILRDVRHLSPEEFEALSVRVQHAMANAREAFDLTMRSQLELLGFEMLPPGRF